MLTDRWQRQQRTISIELLLEYRLGVADPEEEEAEEVDLDKMLSSLFFFVDMFERTGLDGEWWAARVCNCRNEGPSMTAGIRLLRRIGWMVEGLALRVEQ